MSSERKNSVILLMAILCISSLITVVPMMSDDASAAGAYYVLDTKDTITVNADGSTTFNICIENRNAYIAHDTSENLWVKVSATADTSEVTTSAEAYVDGTKSTMPVYLEGGDSAVIEITVKADKYATHGTYTLTCNWSVYDRDGNDVTGTESSSTHALIIKSNYSTSDSYNKFLGVFTNNFDGVLGELWFTLIVSAVLWVAIGAVLMAILVPVAVFLTTRKNDPDRPTLRRSLIRQCLIIIVVYVVSNLLGIAGVDEKTMGTVNDIAYLLFLVVGICITWRIYKTLLDRLAERMRGRDMVAGGEVQDFESFKPLFLYIGEIVLALIGVFLGMGTFGIDLAAIITAAGLVSLGITFGAQQVLAQFFAGLVILSTRPFKKGDLVQIGSGTVVYRVRRVTVMNTELENWDNSDVTIVPNNTITGSMVKNITRDTLRTKLHIFISVSYDTDLPKARAAMLDVANANPRVIKDGSVSRPSTRVTDFESSNIQLRLTVWVDDYNDSGSIGGELRQGMYSKFCELGINIDYEQIVIRDAKVESEEE